MPNISSAGHKLIAASLRSAKPKPETSGSYYSVALQQWNRTVEDITENLANDNPQFRFSLFHHAAGYSDSDTH